ncbi:hypothetical protein AB3S75_000439 [Citrus x aurantiifolia]
MEVEIISRECIKPSSPTPFHLKAYKLCLMDQYQYHRHYPKLFYYPLNLSEATDIDHIVSERLQLLKQSLSETLVRFYPLAGKFTDRYSIECNDEGILFVQARANKGFTLNEFLNQPDLNLINKLIPVDGNERSGQAAGAHVAKVQVTSFSCGGLVIFASISHMFGDGTTYSSFLKSWAATARNHNNNEEESSLIYPSYDASYLFPRYDEFPFPSELTRKAQFARFCKTGRFVMRRFVFQAKAIAELKAKAASSSVQYPSRIEAVSALLSKCIMAAFKSKSGSSGSYKPTLLTHVVNLRRKARPQLPEHLVGNIICYANALICADGEVEVELDGLVCKLRESIMKPGSDFVNSIQGSGGFHNYFKALNDENDVHTVVQERITFTSWGKFGYYEIDFGWGKPIWVSVAGFGESIISLPTVIILMNTRLGDGIEAWVSLLEDYMNLLQVDKELLACATLDPSPLGQA